MQSIQISANVPVDLSLRCLTGRQVRHGNAGIRQQFLTMDGRAFYVSEQHGFELEQRLRELSIRPGERILIYKENVFGAGGVATTRLNVYRATGLVGQQADGTFLVPRVPGSSTAPVLSAPRAIALLRDAVKLALDTADSWHEFHGGTDIRCDDLCAIRPRLREALDKSRVPELLGKSIEAEAHGEGV